MRKNGLFKQIRIGKNGKPFIIYKFRTLKGEPSSNITTSNSPSSPWGRFLRKTHLDELPQLFNILIGDMSFVGPRPDVPGYADKLSGDDRIILTVRPGITGPAQIKYRNEEEILAQQQDPIRYNDEVIWKDKVAINKEYVKNWSLFKDLYYLWKTLFR